jgi:hypothetical protein
MKALAIGGEPATGKTTLIKHIFKDFIFQNFSYGLLKGHYIKNYNLIIMGIYDCKGVFQGTDRLSMAVNNDFCKFIKLNKYNILFEGDRLFSLNNLILVNTIYDSKIIILQQDEITLKNRHLDRNDTQSEVFLKGRKTKISNIKQRLKDKIEVHKLNNIEETIKLANILVDWIK